MVPVCVKVAVVEAVCAAVAVGVAVSVAETSAKGAGIPNKAPREESSVADHDPALANGCQMPDPIPWDNTSKYDEHVESPFQTVTHRRGHGWIDRNPLHPPACWGITKCNQTH